MTRIKEMKVLNIAQPAAHYVIKGGKNVENRRMPTKIRGTIAIYASKAILDRRFEHKFNYKKVQPEECDFGCIIGFVDVVDCITEDQVVAKFKQWFTGPYGYVLENARMLKTPIPVSPPRGAIIWWNMKGADLKKCLDQVPHSSIVPIGVAKDVPRVSSKNSARAKLTPSFALARVIGPEPRTFKAALHKLIDYLETHELVPEGAQVIRSDKKLQEVFGKKRVMFEEIKGLLLKNLS